MEPDHNTDAVTTNKPDPDEPEKRRIKGMAILWFILCLVFDICFIAGVIFLWLATWMYLAVALLCGFVFGFLIAFLFYRVEGIEGYTHPEYVVCRAIVAILVAILWPVFFLARTKAHQATCLHNLHVIGTELLLYAQDWDDTFPPAARWSDAAAAKLKPNETQTVFHCPEAHSAYSYAFNISLDCLPEPDPLVAAQIVMVFEANVAAHNTAGDQTLVAHPPRHSGANEYLFADGHAKPIKADATAGLHWAAQP